MLVSFATPPPKSAALQVAVSQSDRPPAVNSHIGATLNVCDEVASGRCSNYAFDCKMTDVHNGAA